MAKVRISDLFALLYEFRTAIGVPELDLDDEPWEIEPIKWRMVAGNDLPFGPDWLTTEEMVRAMKLAITFDRYRGG